MSTSAPRALTRSVAATLAAAIVALTAPAARAADAPAPEIPTCDHKLATLAVTEPQDTWWVGLQLESPAALIKVYVAQSKCFTLVDRGKGLAAAQGERALAANGDTRVGSNIGKGQMKAADYVLVPDIANKNAHSGGTNVGGAIAGFIPHGFGALVGGLSLKSKTADVVLTLTDVRSTEQVALEQGHAKKTDLGWGAGGGGFFGAFAAAGVSSYSNTDIGQVVAMAYLDAYTKLVNELKANPPNKDADNVQQAVTMNKPGKLMAEANPTSSVVKELAAGTMLYPTGDKVGVWWKVTDELGYTGWVLSTQFQLAK